MSLSEVSSSPFLVLVGDFSPFWLRVVGMTEQLDFYEIHSPWRTIDNYEQVPLAINSQ